MILKTALKLLIDAGSGTRIIILNSDLNPNLYCQLFLDTRGGFVNAEPIVYPLMPAKELCWRTDFHAHWRRIEKMIYKQLPEVSHAALVFAENSAVTLPHTVEIEKIKPLGVYESDD